ncbi:HlyD family efflux transporter periplasmic adaptor subunit [Caulobacter segnis]
MRQRREIVLTAPKSGRVVALQATPGLAVTSASALAAVLPGGADLRAYLWAPSRAVGFVRPGADVRLMYDAFPFQQFGAAHGRDSRSIAQAPTPVGELPIPGETREPLYKITVVLERQNITAYGKDLGSSRGREVIR